MLRELCADAGPDMLREMLNSWETEAARHLAEAQTAIISSDHATLKAAAHAIKGSCSNMGIVRLAELGRLLEEHLQSAAIATELLAEMTAEFQRARSQLIEITAQA